MNNIDESVLYNSKRLMDKLIKEENLLNYDFKNKSLNIKFYINYYLMRLKEMFKASNLDNTFNFDKYLEYCFMDGYCGVLEKEGKLYAVRANWGGELDPYYLPKNLIVENPYLNLSKSNFEIGKDIVLCKNDSMYFGLMPLLMKYCTRMVETDLSLNIAIVQSRAMALFTAADNDGKREAELYLSKLYEGELIAPMDKSFFSEVPNIKAQPLQNTTNQTITNLIEILQYDKASLLNDLGLSANYNMKRESINSNEAQMGEDSLLPLIHDMLRCQEENIDKINVLFNRNIEIRLNSAWLLNNLELLNNLNDSTLGGEGDVIKSEEGKENPGNKEIKSKESNDREAGSGYNQEEINKETKNEEEGKTEEDKNGVEEITEQMLKDFAETINGRSNDYKEE